MPDCASLSSAQENEPWERIAKFTSVWMFFSGQIFAFGGRRGHLIKLLFWDGQGLVLYAKRLERGHFISPSVSEGTISLTPAQVRC